MSEEKIVSVIRDFVEAYVKRDVEKILSFPTEDVVWVQPEGTFKGMHACRVLELCMKGCSHLRLGGFIILKSSPTRHYHAVFNAWVSWEKNIHDMCWFARTAYTRYRNIEVMKWVIMQGVKGNSTLRIGFKFESDDCVKPTPEIIHSHGKTDDRIAWFLDNREFLLKGYECGWEVKS